MTSRLQFLFQDKKSRGHHLTLSLTWKTRNRGLDKRFDCSNTQTARDRNLDKDEDEDSGESESRVTGLQLWKVSEEVNDAFDKAVRIAGQGEQVLELRHGYRDCGRRREPARHRHRDELHQETCTDS